VYTREVALEGVISGPEIEVTLSDSHAHLLRAGATVAIDGKGPDGIPERFRGQISSIIPSGEGDESSYRIRLTAPSNIPPREGETLLVRIPLERRRIYQWMVSWSPD
jgi:hypothetical protein